MEAPDIGKRTATRGEKLGEVGRWKEAKGQREGSDQRSLGNCHPDARDQTVLQSSALSEQSRYKSILGAWVARVS